MQVSLSLKRVGLAIILTTLYSLALLLKIPFAFTQSFHSFSPLLFLILLSVFYGSFSLPGEARWFTGLLITLLIFALSLSFLWASGFSDNKILGGVLPYKDGYQFFYGAQLLLAKQPSPDFGPSSYRPLFPGLLSSLLFLTQQNLQMVLALLIGMLAVACYLSACQVFSLFGKLPASIYIVLLYFYIQPFIGYTMSEVPGLLLGALGAVLILRSAQTNDLRSFLIGMVTLTVGLSVRAGTFFILPLLILWAGWAFRGGKSYSYKIAAAATAVTGSAFVFANTVFNRLADISSRMGYANFAFSLYGQVRGGIGWGGALQELKTSNAALIYKESLAYFLRHPLSFFIGAAKSYRDSFMPGSVGAFGFIAKGQPDPVSIGLWAVGSILLAAGLVQSIRRFRSPVFSLIAVSFLGIFLSIPFLPPIDGGWRFYAASMPFLFAAMMPALGRSADPASQEKQAEASGAPPRPLIEAFSLTLLTLTVILPIVLHRTAPQPSTVAVSCPDPQIGFAINVRRGSYIDLVPKGGASCGYLPGICLSDFDSFGGQRNVDTFFQQVVATANSSGSTTRFLAAMDLIDMEIHYFTGSTDQLHVGSVRGCASTLQAQTPSFLAVESVTAP